MNTLLKTAAEQEDLRLKTLAQYKIQSTEGSAQLDDLAILATSIFSVPYAFISFIDDKKQFLKSSISLPFYEIPLNESICISLINKPNTSAIFVEDVTKDETFKNHPFILKHPFIRFFLTVPLTSPNGCIIGSMAVLDSKERNISCQQIVNLHTLANQVVSQLELNKTNQELQKIMLQLSKLSDLGVYAASIAHEINTPLTILTGQHEILALKVANNQVSADVIKKFTDSIGKNINRITNIVSGLKNITRNSVDDPFEKVYVNQIFTDINELCSQKIRGKNISLDFDCPKNANLECRPSQISQVLINLINNSVDAIEDLPAKWIRVECQVIEKNVCLTVTDSGNGIPTEISNKMFSHFFTTKPIGTGTGIGLTLSSEIAKKHNGEIFVDSNNINTKFVLKIPILSSLH